MSELLRFFKDMRDNGYGLAEIAAQLGTSAIAEPVAGFAAMYDPVHGADAIREGMTYQPRSEAAKMYQQGASNVVGQAVKPVMPVIDAWQRGVDVAGKYSPAAGAALQTVPTALGALMGYKPAMQTGRQVSNSLGAMQQRMIANANAPRTLNIGYRGQRGAANFDYRDAHRAPSPQDNAAAHALNDIYPDDIYSANAQRYYGTGDPFDKKTFQIINSLRNNPDKKVTIYRAIPDDINADINAGDWVGLTPEYARMHGDSRFDGKYKILKKEVTAKELHNNGDSIHEWGYNPVQTTPKRPLTEFEQAHLLAQQRAALPVNQRGLGLPADNTAMDRARAMGGIEGVHYSRTGADVQELDSGKYAISPFDAIGTHIGSKEAAAQRFNTTRIAIEDPKGVSYPVVMLGNKELRNKDSQPMSEDALVNDLISRGAWDGTDYHKKNAELRKQYFSEYDRIPYINDVEDAGKVSHIVPPKNIRSRFAAFDPFNRDSSNLLATTAPLVPTTALGAYMYNENRKKSQGKQ